MKSKREEKVENNKSDEQMVHKLNVVSDSGNKKTASISFSIQRFIYNLLRRRNDRLI